MCALVHLATVKTVLLLNGASFFRNSSFQSFLYFYLPFGKLALSELNKRPSCHLDSSHCVNDTRCLISYTGVHTKCPCGGCFSYVVNKKTFLKNMTHVLHIMQSFNHVVHKRHTTALWIHPKIPLLETDWVISCSDILMSGVFVLFFLNWVDIGLKDSVFSG